MKFFTLKEASALLPTLATTIVSANADLEAHWLKLQEANQAYRLAEQDIDEGSLAKLGTVCQLRESRARFEQAIAQLSEVENDYLTRLNYWVETITKEGVILRDIKEGLLDFPSRQGSLEYYLCWKMGEKDISHWHLTDDGFSGRKPLATLLEYC